MATDIKAEEITEIIRQQLSGISKGVDVSEVGTVVSVGDGIARVYGLDRVMAGELVEFPHDVAGLAPPRHVPAIELGELGDYRLVREIGRGGMGVVYEAIQISLNRRVALKILPFAAAMDSIHLRRFQTEAQAAILAKKNAELDEQ